MRPDLLFKNILLELNVINIPDIEKYVNTFVVNIEDDNCKKWFFNKSRKFLINHDESNSKITNLSKTAPDFLKKKFEEKVPLYRFENNAILTRKFSHIVDWLNAIKQYSTETINNSDHPNKSKVIFLAKKYLNSLNQINFGDLLKDTNIMDAWFKLKNDSVVIDDVQDEVVKTIINYDNGIKWVQLLTKDQLEREGKLLQHCVGTYYQAVKKGKTNIYSLRDKSNNPHVTVEETNNLIVQIKGKQNKAPVEKYVPYVKDFLNKMKIPCRSDLYDITAMGFMYDKNLNKYGTIKDLSNYVDTISNIEIYQKDDNGFSAYYFYNNDKIIAELSYNTLTIKDENYNKDNILQTLFILCNKIKEFSQFDVIKIKKYDSYGNSNIILFKEKSSGKFKYINDINILQKFNTLELKDIESNGFDLFYNGQLIYTVSIYRQICIDHNNNYSDIEGILEFLNSKQIQSLPEDKKPVFLLDDSVVLFKNKYQLYNEVATLKKVFDNDVKLLYYDGLYKLVKNNFLLASFKSKSIVIKSNISKYSKDLVNIFNSDGFNITNDILKEFAKYLLTNNIIVKKPMYNKTIWSIPKETKNSMEGTTKLVQTKPKNFNIVEDDNVIGALIFDTAKEIKSIECSSGNYNKVGEFLYKFSKKYPDISFSYYSFGSEKQYRGGLKIPSEKRKVWNIAGYFIKDNKFERISDFYPEEKILEDNNLSWVKVPFLSPINEPRDGCYKLISGKETVLGIKLALHSNKIESVLVIGNDDYNNKVYKEPTGVDIVPYINNINQLIKKQKLIIENGLISKYGLEVIDNQIQIIDENSIMKSFSNGKITYDNGYVWLRDSYEKDTWVLLKNVNEQYKWIVKCKISQNGLHSIEFDREAKKNPRLVHEYLNDMYDIVEKL